MKVIGFGHRQRVGKDLACKILFAHIKDKYPHIKTCRCSFGDQIKEIAYQMYKWGGLQPGIYYENHPDEKDQFIPAIGRSPRGIWIELGFAGQQICDKTWPEMAFADADGDLLLVSDLRRPIETEYVHQFNGICVRIDRPSAKISDDKIDIQLKDHTGWDHIVVNDGTIRNFGDKIRSLFDGWWTDA